MRRGSERLGLRGSLIGLSISGLVLASTALVPASVAAQTIDLGTGSVTLNEAADFIPGSVFTNGEVIIQPFATFDPFLFDATLSDTLGPASLTKIGTRPLELLSAGSTHSGETLLTASLVTTRVANALSPFSVLTIGTTAIVDLGGFDQQVAALGGAAGGILRNTSMVNAPATLTVGGSLTRNFFGLISETGGAISIVKDGSGLQGFDNAANNFTGGVSLRGGTLRYGLDGSLGTGAITVDALGATINPLSNGTVLSNDVVLNSGVDVTLSTVTRWNGVVSGAGAIEKLGSGDLVLANAANSFTGGIDVSDGRLLIAADNVLGTGDVRFTNSIARFGTDGNISASVDNNFILQAQMNVDAPSVGNVLTLAGVVSGAEGIFLRAPGGGTLSLTGNNSFSGGIEIDTGNLSVGSNAALGTASVFFSTTSGNLLAGADGLVVSNTLRLARDVTVNSGAGTFTLSGGLINATGETGGITKSGAGALIISGTTTYTGGTSVNEGTLQVDGTLGGDVQLIGGTTVTGSGSIGGTLSTAEGATIAPGNSPGTLAIGGNLELISADTLEFELANPAVVGGGVNDLITVGGDLILDGAIDIIPLTGFSFGTYTIITYGGTLTDNGLSLGLLPTDVGATVELGTAGLVQLDVFFAGVEQYWDGANTVSNNLIDGGTGTWSDAGLNWTNLAGDTNLPWADVVAVFTTTGGDVTVDGAKTVAGLTFEVDGYNLSGDELQLSVVNPTLIDVQTGTTTISNVISGSAITKGGAGTLVLNGANTYTGDTALNAGAIQLGNASALGAGSLAMADGTVLRNGVTPLSIANDIAVTGTGVIDLMDGLFFLAGDISGGALSILSTDVGATLANRFVSLSGANTYTGGTTITGVTVSINADTHLGDAAGTLAIEEGQLFTQSTFTMNRATTLTTFGEFAVNLPATVLTKDGLISGDGELRKLGTGTLVLGNAANSFAGDVVIQGGTLQVDSEGALGAGNLRFEALGGTLALTSGIETAKTVLLSADGTIDTVAGDFDLVGRDLGHRRAVEGWSGTADADRRQHLQRRHQSQCRRTAHR
ncbi:MAG: beta strand repeat-containing protein [Polymorphobacter sp.]|uniref:beta strand repeat-containing protein n=1 Tax=Polymorphobacter sp. TaxID=1909290 RepID=UPI003A8C60B2